MSRALLLTALAGAALIAVPVAAQQGQSVPPPPPGPTVPQGRIEYTRPPIAIPPTPREERREAIAPPVISLPLPDRAPIVTDLAWVRRAAPDFPATAIANGITSGRVNLRCTAGENGALTDCEIMEETPAGQGFGRAALSAARRSRVRPRTENGVAVPSEARFTIAFLSPAEPVETGPAAPPNPGAPVVIKDIVPIPAPAPAPAPAPLGRLSVFRLPSPGTASYP